MPNRALVHLAVGALTVLPTCGVLAGTATAAERPAPAPATAPQTTADSTAPPPGEAEAYALLIDPLLAVGHTKATANGSSGSASGNAVELGGEPLIDGMTGGSQQGAGSKQGSLLDTGVTPLGQLQLTPWSATVTSAGTGSTSDGDAALLRMFLIDPTMLRAALLQSHSHAESGSEGSSSSSSSDGAVVNAGDGALDVHVLHAESSSKTGGSSYLLDINGNQVGTSDDANGSCAVAVPDVVALSCLTATGGTAGAASTAGAAVGEATLGSGQAGGTVAGTKASGRTVTQGSGTAPTSGASSSGNSSGGLPFTGTSFPPFLALGAFALAAGAWLQQAGRRFGFAARP
jgi:hypothetical protein